MSYVKAIGLDILPGSSSSGKGKTKSKFSAVIISKTASEINIDQEIAEINFFDVIKLIQSVKPDVVAFDNIFEIVNDSKEILNLAKRFPDHTSIVQVTGSPKSGYQKLIKLAESQSFWNSKNGKNGKPNSLESANLIAKLALNGIGYKVIPFEDEIKVTISKTRNIGKGGWSAPRYERNMKISVKSVTDELINRLKALDAEFDSFIYPKRTVVIVHPQQKHPISFHQLITISKQISNELAHARVSRIPKSSLEFIPLSGRAPSILPSKTIKSIIVGVDPGTTTGLTILDAISGTILDIHSAREFSTSQIIRKITSYGKAVLICSDVRNPIPHLVKKLSTILNAQLFAPDNPNTPRSEKRSLVQSYLENAGQHERTDNHQRDALFAAIKGYNSIERAIYRIKTSLEEKPELASQFNTIINHVISGISIYDAIAVVEAQLVAEQLRNKLNTIKLQNKLEINPDISRAIISQSKKIEELYISLRMSEREKNNYKKDNNELKKNLKALMKKFNSEKRKSSTHINLDRRIDEKNRDIRQLHNVIQQKDDDLLNANETIDKLKKIRLIWQRGDLLPLKSVKKLHENELRKAQKEFGFRPGDILLLHDPSGGSSSAAKWLIDRKIRAIIVSKGYLRRLSSLAIKIIEEAEMPIFEENIVTYDPEKPPETRKNKIIYYEGLYIVNKRYILQKIYEQELWYAKKREEARIKQHKEDRIPEIPVTKHKMEILLERYQENRVHERLVQRENFVSNFDFEEENNDF